METTTVDADEIAKFSALANKWWDPHGAFRPLHVFNPVRLGYIKASLCRHFDRDPQAERPFEGLRLLDIGCGGGLLSEPLARLGATVVGADAAANNIAVARLHAQRTGVDVDYRATTAEALAAAGERFDVVLAMEIVEHVSDVGAFVACCAEMVRPGGLLLMATINRTPKAFVLAIVGAEYVVRWLPKGTHRYDKLVRPSELDRAFADSGLDTLERTGVSYDPVRDRWALSADLDVNYMMLAARPG